MKIDASKFPVVRMQENVDEREPVDAVLDCYLRLLQRDELFVVIADSFPDQSARKQESVEDRRSVTLFMKEHKAEIKRLIKAHIQIVTDLELREEAQQFSILFKKFWGYPMVVVASEEEALHRASILLECQ